MEKIDILITFFGILSYIAIVMDLRNYEQRLAQFEELQEKKRLYAQRLSDKKKADKAREEAAKRRTNRQKEVSQLTSVVEKLGAIEDAESMRKTHITAGKIDV